MKLESSRPGDRVPLCLGRKDPRWYTLRGFHNTHDVMPKSSAARI